MIIFLKLSVFALINNLVRQIALPTNCILLHLCMS